MDGAATNAPHGRLFGEDAGPRGGALLPSLFWWHRRSLRLRRRSAFLLSWMLASLGFETLLYALALRFGFLRQSSAATACFGAPLCLTLILFVFLKRIDPTSMAGVADSSGASARSHLCAVCAIRVPRYDHYCSWVDEPIGSANHRAYLAFVASMFVTCLVGGLQLVQTSFALGWSAQHAWHANRSSVFLSCGGYGIAVACAVGVLLGNQLMLIATGRTTSEARRHARVRAAVAGGGRDGAASEGGEVGGGRKVDGRGEGRFLEQTAPLGAALVAALRIGQRQSLQGPPGAEQNGKREMASQQQSKRSWPLNETGPVCRLCPVSDGSMEVHPMQMQGDSQCLVVGSATCKCKQLNEAPCPGRGIVT